MLSAWNAMADKMSLRARARTEQTDCRLNGTAVLHSTNAANAPAVAAGGYMHVHVRLIFFFKKKNAL